MKKYEENISIIASLKQGKADLESSNNQAVNAKEAEKANQTKTLIIQMQDARRLVNQKKMICILSILMRVKVLPN